MTNDELKILSEQKAQEAVDFFSFLKHTKGIWHGVKFDLYPWQDEIIRETFGTLKPNGYRRYNTVYLEIPKKQGKSELGAGVALKLFCADDEWAAQVYGCGTDRAQASLIFDVSVDMVDQNAELRKLVKPIMSKKRMIYTPNNSFYQVVSAEAFSKHGIDASGVIFDELHAQPNRDLWDVMTNGSGDARMQQLIFVMTTAGDDPDETSIGWEIHEQAKGILNGTLTIPNMYAKIYSVDEKANWEDEESWKKANPSIGHHLRIDTFRDAFVKAKINPADERKFRQLRLNQWPKDKTSKWVSINIWNSNTGAVLADRLKGRRCVGGLDLSSKLDMTALALAFEPVEDDTWDVLMYYWIPEDGLNEKENRDKVPYREWVKDGLIEATPGNVIDYRYIHKRIAEVKDEFDIYALGFDPWNAQQTATEMTDMGINCLEVRQGYKTMSPAMKELEKLIVSKNLRHGNNPVLRWNFSNVEVKSDENGNIRPTKGKGKKSQKIDGIVALINAISVKDAETEESIYESRGMRKL